MGFEKIVEQQIFGVTVQNSDLRMVTGDSSGGTFTNRINPLRGSLLWDKGMYVLQNVAVANGATGGSYTVTIETDAVVGFTGLPIARVTLGPNSPTTAIMDSLHQSGATPLPTHIFIDQTATGGGLTLTCEVIAKQYRGTFGTAGQGTSERVLQGVMIRGLSNTPDFSGDEGFSVDVTFALGTSGSNMGMNRLRHWDNAFFWAVSGNTEAGEHDVDIIAVVGGNTVSIASTGVGGALGVPDAKIALTNAVYGQCPTPSAIIWTEVGAGGVSDARVVMLAKSGRGGLAKR